MQVSISDVRRLRFTDGTPVRAASGIAPYRGGFLIVQDDSTHGCHWDGDVATAVRLLPPVQGRDVFDEASGTKHLKPDLEAVIGLSDDSLLALGSGSTPERMRAVHLVAGVPRVLDLTAVYARIVAALGIEADQLNLEGACLVEGRLRWFQRGIPAAGAPSSAVDLMLTDVLAGTADVLDVAPIDLGEASGVALAVTDAVHLADGRIIVSAAAEDTGSTYDDGPMTACAVALLADSQVLDLVTVPRIDDVVVKIEGLAVRSQDASGLEVVAVVDHDDPLRPSTLLTLEVTELGQREE